MNIIDNSGKGLATLGRNEDRFMAHVAPGEMVVPPVISDNTKALIRKEMAAVGLDPSQYEVGEGMSINPITGQAEFGFLKKLAKTVKKVVKVIAPIAAVIPGPWQVPAIMYNRGNAVLKIAKGEGGIGDLITAFTPTSAYTGGKTGNIFGNTKEFFTKGTDGVGFFGNVGKGLGNVKEFVTKGTDGVGFFGNTIGKGYEYVMPGKDNVGLFDNLTGGGGANRKLSEISKLTNLDGSVVYTDAAGKVYSQDQITALQKEAQGSGGFNPFMKKATTAAEVTVQSGDSLTKIAEANNTTAEALAKANNIANPDKIFPGQKIKIPGAASSSSNFLSGLISGGGADNVGNYGVLGDIGGSITDSLGLTKYGDPTNTGGGSGIDPKLAGLALLYGKVVKDAAKKNEGGLTDIRQSIRPDLNPAPVFAGFDLGVRKAAAYGGPIGFGRQQYNQGGLAEIGELDMRDGGESAGPGTGTSDDIPAMLSDGEFVMTAAANNGAGGFKFNKTKKGLELIASSKPNRKNGVNVMNQLMDTFEKYNKSGSIV